MAEDRKLTASEAAETPELVQNISDVSDNLKQPYDGPQPDVVVQDDRVTIYVRNEGALAAEAGSWTYHELGIFVNGGTWLSSGRQVDGIVMYDAITFIEFHFETTEEPVEGAETGYVHRD